MKIDIFRFLCLLAFSIAIAGCKQAANNPPPEANPTSAEIATIAPTPVPRTAASPTGTPQPQAAATVEESPTTAPEPSPTPMEFSAVAQSVVIYNDDLNLAGSLCTPQGSGPFPAVVYNHGGTGDIIGGAPEETCQALAEGGLVGFAPIRRQTNPINGHVEDVMLAINYVKSLAYVDPERLGLMGFSRGGLLTYMVSSQRTDLQAVIIMAAALPRDGDFSKYAQGINAPILLMVSSNDLPAELNKNQNLVEGMQAMEAALRAAGKDVQLLVYPPYEPHGHMMFFEIGDYWEDAIRFLQDHLE